MKEIEENEKEIISKLTFNKEEKSDWDENGYRVHWLVKYSLIFIAYSKEHGGWETLYFEPKTKTFWERKFMNGDIQGGGPPSLFKISVEDAHNKYEF
jgi:hypothetical protein